MKNESVREIDMEISQIYYTMGAKMGRVFSHPV
jgi:hypothetical protein